MLSKGGESIADILPSFQKRGSKRDDEAYLNVAIFVVVSIGSLLNTCSDLPIAE